MAFIRDYPVRLDQFEGPLDLLLFLIKKDDLDIFDIPIYHITTQFCHYLDQMDEVDLDIAGDYLVMAASLMQVKSRMLLPRTTINEDGEIVEEDYDPREDLIEKLLEYKRYKDAADGLSHRPRLGIETFIRDIDADADDFVDDDPTSIDNLKVNITQLMSAFQKIVEERKLEIPHEVELPKFFVQDQIRKFTAILIDKQDLVLDELFREKMPKVHIIICFISILEMAKQGWITIYQVYPFAPIRLMATETINEGLLYEESEPNTEQQRNIDGGRETSAP